MLYKILYKTRGQGSTKHSTKHGARVLQNNKEFSKKKSISLVSPIGLHELLLLMLQFRPRQFGLRPPDLIEIPQPLLGIRIFGSDLRSYLQKNKESEKRQAVPGINEGNFVYNSFKHSMVSLKMGVPPFGWTGYAFSMRAPWNGNLYTPRCIKQS